MEKINNLFVASKINETSTFYCNNTIGHTQHDVNVSKKKYLVYSTIDENGTIRYYDYESKRLLNDQTITHSYITNANKKSIEYYSFKDIINNRFNKKKLRKKYEIKEEKFGFFMPLNEYIEMNMPFYKKEISSLRRANAIVRFLNIGSIGSINLDNFWHNRCFSKPHMLVF